VVDLAAIEQQDEIFFWRWQSEGIININISFVYKPW